MSAAADASSWSSSPRSAGRSVGSAEAATRTTRKGPTTRDGRGFFLDEKERFFRRGFLSFSANGTRRGGGNGKTQTEF